MPRASACSRKRRPIGVISYSPLARGVLTGKYEQGATPAADTRAGRGDRRLQQAEWRPESLEHLLQALCQASGGDSVLLFMTYSHVSNIADRLMPKK
jgi:aryl-alcohol dehydrogenase-like predicted oxidoreductase